MSFRFMQDMQNYLTCNYDTYLIHSIISSRYVPSFLPPSFAKEPEKKVRAFPMFFQLHRSVYVIPLVKCHLNLQKEEERPKEKEKEKGKPRAIDKFMEELKFEQEQREKRNQDRDHRREGRQNDSSMVGSYLC
jgi:U2-associated protein SR140